MANQASANHPKQPRRILALQRRRTALQMRLAGADVAEIAQALGISKGRVSQLIEEAMNELHGEIGMDAEKYREVIARNVFRAMARIEKVLMSNDDGAALAAADRMGRQNERLAKLYGTDAPERKDITSGGQVITFNVQRGNDSGKDDSPSPDSA